MCSQLVPLKTCKINNRMFFSRTNRITGPSSILRYHSLNPAQQPFHATVYLMFSSLTKHRTNVHNTLKQQST
uniref:Uncharacterized protein n=1 Tax=Arundo donax TaxID=35708 RepID=A0A0A9HB07_ARUDO